LQPVLTAADHIQPHKRRFQRDLDNRKTKRFFQVISRHMVKIGALCLNRQDKNWNRRWQFQNPDCPGKIENITAYILLSLFDSHWHLLSPNQGQAYTVLV
jgi:hypothetical protein